MTQIKTNILFNEMRFAFNPSKLTKCGEIQIDDNCTKAYLFCAFCCDNNDPDATKFFTTLQEFIDHIRWHRSDDLDSPILQNGLSNIAFEGLEDDSRSDLSAAPPIQETEFLTDWIAPPEELFASSTITNFIEMEPQLTDVKSDLETTQEIDKNNSLPKQQNDDVDEGVPELTGEVFIELLDFYKKCPCLWHDLTASITSSDVIDGAYKLLAAHFNKCSQQSKSVDYVRRVLFQIRNCFLEEYRDVKQEGNDALPWYFPYLSFILDCDSNELDRSCFTDFTCPVCSLELMTQDDLWNHILKLHIESPRPKDQIDAIPGGLLEDLDERTPPNTNTTTNKTSVCEYPAEVVDKFIDLYRSQTRLWDKNDKEYYSRLLRRKSYDLLLNVLREHDPKATYTEVGRRINYLRDEIIGEKKKDNLSTDSLDDNLENTDEILENNEITENNIGAMVEPCNQIQQIMDNITVKKNRNPPPQLKVKPASFRKKIKTGKCPICSTTFNEHSAWLSHLESAHNSEDYQSKDGFFYCTVCGWQNRTKKLLMRHLRNKHTNNLRRCTDCNLGFRLLSMLVEHRAKVHNDFNPFKCEVCGEGFTSRSHLRAHTSTAHKGTEERSHWCIHCGSKFADRKSYKAHIRRHKFDKKELPCKFCQKKLSTMAELRKHMRTHLNLYAHKCDKCGKGFQSAQLLVNHLNDIHNGTNMSSHIYRNIIKKQIAGGPYQRLTNQSQTSCDECGTKFFRKSSLQKHKRLKHDINTSTS
ncbi:PR domain zinc finger protein 5-like [Episyrphus balteatus]|uniref:PR domain zinc finger protein 5-like n=1 Tax=Episyrphus balteatus TaxID=286459 RepID=UPI002485F50E|nr:PR domain zinc finger protein 5-like [Episyrphus balteatus]